MKVRKLSGSVKRIIGLFGGLVVLLSAVFGVAVYNSVANSEESIPVGVESTVYDVSGNRVYLENPASIYKSHLGDYRLVDSNTNTYSLGENTVIYDGGSLKVLGGGYQIVSETEISQLPVFSEIEDFNYAGFFKLADRKYLLIGNSIGGEGYPVSTSGYLFVVMDKTGNAMLLNNEICEKTTSASAISVDGEYVFDIANELLTYGEDKVVDCSQIIGSTNEYDEDKDPTAIREKINSLKEQGRDVKNPDEVLIDAKGGTGGQGGNGGQGGDGGQGGAGGSGGPGGQGGTGSAPDVINARKTVNLYQITPSYTQATVEYYVNDPYGLLGDITITINNLTNGWNENTNPNGDKPRTITCDLDATKTTIFNLVPSTKYELILEASADASKTSKQYFFTLDPEAEISVTSITENSVTCNVKYVQGLTLSSADAVLCAIDDINDPDKAISTWEITSFSASSSNGQTLIFSKKGKNGLGDDINFSEIGKYLAIYITNAKYKHIEAGNEVINEVNVPSKAYFTNVTAGKAKWNEWSENNPDVLNYNLNKNEEGEYACCPKDDAHKAVLKQAIEQYDEYSYDNNQRPSGFTDWDQKRLIDILTTIKKDYGWTW